MGPVEPKRRISSDEHQAPANHAGGRRVKQQGSLVMVGGGALTACSVIFTPESIAQRLGGSVVGNPAEIHIERIDTLENACPRTISWATGKLLADRIARSAAGVVIVPAEMVHSDEPDGRPPERCYIVVADPEMAVVKLLHLFSNPSEVERLAQAGVHPRATVDPSAKVDPTAYVGPCAVICAGAKIGPRTVLHAGVVVNEDATIGADCDLRANVVIEHACTVGDRVIIHANASIGADGFGYLFRNGRHVKIPQIGSVVIEDDVEIGANSCVDRARTGVTRVGRGSKIDNHVQIAHNCDIGSHVLIAALSAIGGSTSIGSYTVIGGMVGVSDHLRIGQGVRIAARSAVTRHVKPGEIVRGYPAVENKQYVREQIALRKLPELLARLESRTKTNVLTSDSESEAL